MVEIKAKLTPSDIVCIMLSVIVIALIAGQVGFRTGFNSGLDHALSDSSYIAVDDLSYTDPFGKDYDRMLLINLDGDIYEQGLSSGKIGDID